MIIKQPKSERVETVSLEDAFSGKHRLRIPGQRVRLAEHPTEPPPNRPARVVRRASAKDAEPVDLEWLHPVVQEPQTVEEGEADEAEPAPPTPQELEAAWQARVEEEAAAARQAGYDQGRADAAAEAEQEVAAARDAFSRDIDALRDEWEQFLLDVEPQLASLAFRIAETILDAPLPHEVRALSEQELSRTIERFIGESTIDIMLHPVDYLRLEESGVAEQLAASHPRMQWHPDSELREGEWVVESPSAVVRRLQDELIDNMRARLGLLDATGNAPRSE